ncbi:MULTISPECIES: BON domain-containing protein [Rubrivivax]|uniref:BON domain-containing protein n=1 Tax=Rubrivivax benzoatilyticus TaxID=316997 RepID=A0ABX0HUT4_9BURK|nr:MULTISPECIES: BON domain-containing protein [Rubrivivax]EGJ09682.1 transport protein [Rubrivivax benzoatilyticus JA2 = ATCC BAA-35]MCD0421119.1 BON domain-containing protein [Rubrivivax sp. JA1024]NHK98789.1 BON domain-containing protein [Rubrivivax benzoatilyticus]NHL24291.1 BON domain-containing protein [Rubrivivax benzoatilyticus]
MRPLALALAAAAAATTLSACAPLIVGGAMVGGSMMIIDRRTSGAQVEDQAIELKGASVVRDLATLGHVNVTSYNRMVLLTGEVPTEDDRLRVENAVRRVENVRSVTNELAVAGNSSLSSRSNDLVLTSKVKATFVDAKDLQAPSVKVITERGTVYLMGRVTEREAARAADLARSVSGVQKVVRVFEVISEAELANLQKATQPSQPASGNR